MLTARRGKLAHVEALIAWHADVNAAAANTEGDTALISAGAGGHVEVVRALLAAGAGLDAADSGGWTALMWASLNSHVEVVRVLLASGANKHLITAYNIAYWTSGSATIRALLDLAP